MGTRVYYSYTHLIRCLGIIREPTLWGLLLQHTTAHNMTLDGLQESFDEFDVDGSGDIDKEEICELCQGLSDEFEIEMDSQRLARAMEEMDTVRLTPTHDGRGAHDIAVLLTPLRHHARGVPRSRRGCQENRQHL